MSEARAIALKAHPGKITDEELAKEAVAAVCVISSIFVKASLRMKWVSMRRPLRY